MALYTNLIVVAGIDTSTNTTAAISSPDGITWTAITGLPGAAGTHVSVTGDSYFIATGSAGAANNYAYSNDGVTFTTATAPPLMACIEWANNYYVDLAANVSYRSATAGGTWSGPTSTGNSSGQVGHRLINRGTLLVGAIRSTSNQIVYSTDEGATWTAVTPNSRSVLDIDYGAGRYVAAQVASTGSATDWVTTSTDGITWSSVTTGVGAGHGIASLSYGGGLFVGIGANAAGPPAVRTFTSTDGLTWSVHTPTGLPTTGFFTTSQMVYWAGLFIWVNSGSGTVYTSADGVTWTGTSFTNRDWRGVDAGTAIPRGGIYVDGAVHF